MKTIEPNRLHPLGGQKDETIIEPAGGTVAHLRAKTGRLQSVRSSFAVSSEAGRGIREIERAQIRAQVRVAGHATAIVEAQMTTALINAAVPVFNAMVGQLNAATNAADQSLSELEAAAIQSHLLAREQNRGEIVRIGRHHGLAEEEIDACRSFSDANAAEDIGKARERTQGAKQANQNLYDRALGSLLTTRLPHTER